MKRRIATIMSVALVLSALCAAISSCSKVDADYLIEGARDNGFVAAYRGYFAIDDGSVFEISGNQFDRSVLGDDSQYKSIGYQLITFEAKAERSDPLTWTYEKNKYVSEEYDVNVLKDQLKQMGVSYTGDVYIITTSFESYTVIEANSLDNNTVMDTTYGLFRDGSKIELPADIEIQDIRTVYKHK